MRHSHCAFVCPGLVSAGVPGSGVILHFALLSLAFPIYLPQTCLVQGDTSEAQNQGIRK